MKIFIILIPIMFFLSCEKAPIEVKTTDNCNIQVELLFTVDGVKVYRFFDGSYTRCLAIQDKRLDIIENAPNGKTTRPDELTTIIKNESDHDSVLREAKQRKIEQLKKQIEELERN